MLVCRYCPDCRLGIGACAICKQTGVVGQHILKCKMGSCGYYFHNQCLNGLRDSGLLKIHRCQDWSPSRCHDAPLPVSLLDCGFQKDMIMQVWSPRIKCGLLGSAER